MSGIGSLHSSLNRQLGDMRDSQNLREVMRERLEKANSGQLEQSAPQAAQPQTRQRSISENVPAQASSNVMSGNFMKLESSRSKYVEAHLASFGQKTLMETLQQRNTTALILEAKEYFASIDSDTKLYYAKMYRACRQVDGMMLRKQAEKEQEAGEEALDEIKSERDRLVKEATTPTDANGNPIVVGPDAAEAPPAEISVPGQNAPAPDIPAAQPAPAQTAPAPSPAAHFAPQAASGVPLVGGTVDITI